MTTATAPDAAPATDNLSPHLLDRIRAILTAHGVGDARLSVGAPHLNLNAYQRGRLFVKVNRTGERHGRAERELHGARWATEHHIVSSVPLVPQVLEVEDETGEVRDLTVWQWSDSCTAPALYDQVRLIGDVLIRIAATPAPVAVTPFDLSFFLNRIRTRLDGIRDPLARRLMRAAESSAADIIARLDSTRYVWLHGDLHAENVLWQVSGQPCVLDWESHARGPVEWDIAQLFRSVYLDFPAHADIEKGRCVTAAVRRFDQHLRVDWALVEAVARFRAASSASHRLVHGHDPRKQALDLQMMASLPFAHLLPQICETTRPVPTGL